MVQGSGHAAHANFLKKNSSGFWAYAPPKAQTRDRTVQVTRMRCQIVHCGHLGLALGCWHRTRRGRADGPVEKNGLSGGRQSAHVFEANHRPWQGHLLGAREKDLWRLQEAGASCLACTLDTL